MLTMTKPLVASLNVQQSGPLGPRRAAHLLRRCSFHFSKERVDQLALLDADQAVDLLFDTPSPAPYLVRPLYVRNLTSEDFIQDWIPTDGTLLNKHDYDQVRKRRAVSSWWLRNAIVDDTAHHKCAFFLHTTFTTSHEGLVINSPVNGQNQNLTRDISRYLYDQLNLFAWLTTNGTSLKTAAIKMTLDNLMLGYLNNRENFAAGPNENYAREFFELFTIGRGDIIAPGEYTNYNETDVSLAADLLTGFSTKVRRNSSDIDPDTGIPRGTAYPSLHNPSDKTFSIKFGNQTITGQNTEAGMHTELSDFVDMIFGQMATAENYSRKLYRFFVGIDLDTMFVDEMAADLMANNYDWIATLKKLAKSAHFYSKCDPNPDYVGGNLLKSPIEMVTEAFSFFHSDLPPIADLLNPTSLEIYNHAVRFPTGFLFNYYGENTALKLFAPPNVAGYDAYHQEPDWDKHWYSPGAIPYRYGLAKKTISEWNLTPNIRTRIDSVEFANYLHAQGVDVGDANVLMDYVLCLFPQSISAARRAVLMDIFLNLNQGVVNWLILWSCYKGIALPPPFMCDPMGPPVGNDSAIRPHLDALFEAILAAHEFQLK